MALERHHRVFGVERPVLLRVLVTAISDVLELLEQRLQLEAGVALWDVDEATLWAPH